MAEYVTINKQRFKYAKRINGVKNEQIGKYVNYATDTIDKITRKDSTGSVDLNVFKKLCRYLDVYPSYLTGEYNEQASEMLRDIKTLRKPAFFKKYGNNITENEYVVSLADAKKRVDPDGVYIPTYTQYLSEVSKNFCISRFKSWLLSINANEFIPWEFMAFPTNDELKNTLSNMEVSELYDFWESMTHSAYDYMVEHGHYEELHIEDLSSEEIGKRFMLKMKDMNKTRLEEI